MNLPIVDYLIIYNNKNITADVSSQVISIEYTDKIAGQSDELEITFEDVDQKFIGSWYPAKGDTLQLFIRSNGTQLNCGVFTIDELESESSTAGDTFTMRALAAGVNKKLRTKNSYAHAGKTLQQIAETVAQNMGLTVVGNIQNIQFARAHQYRETDLAFLNRVASAYGYVFSVRDTQLCFVYYQDIEGKDPVLTLSKTDIISSTLKDTTNKTFKSSRIRHHDMLNKALISDTETEDDSDFEGEGVDDDEMYDRVENLQQAKARTKFGLYNKNSKGVGGDITIPGNLYAVSGNNIQLKDRGNFNGTYHILEAKHSLNRQGAYLTTVNTKRVKK